jgi:quercetin dioxygenase-like cupin family protein
MVTEDMAPGDEFPTHKHLGQDEILYIVKGTFTFIWETRNAICTQEERRSFRRIPGSA